jgi:Zinc knuckle
MIEHFRTLGGNADQDADGKEVSLAAVVDPDDECNNCGKKGHHAKDCPKPKKGGGKWRKRNSGGGKNSKCTQNRGQCFTSKCDNCGKTGHKASQCWEKEENAHLRPKGYKPKGSGNEQANATVDCVEYLLASLEFPDTPKLMLDPNIWVADTAATVHSTPHEIGMTNVHEVSNDEAAVVAANGAVEETMKIGDLPGTMTDKKGNKLGNAMIKGCSIVPSNKFNLYSLTQALLNKWTLHGNAEAIWLAKGNKKVVFDIKIHTPKGVVFCMNLCCKVQLTKKALVTITINDAHDCFGHVSKETTKAMANGLGITLKPGAMIPCEACATEKAR